MIIMEEEESPNTVLHAVDIPAWKRKRANPSQNIFQDIWDYAEISGVIVIVPKFQLSHQLVVFWKIFCGGLARCYNMVHSFLP